jgi:hypothetical protein
MVRKEGLSELLIWQIMLQEGIIRPRQPWEGKAVVKISGYGYACVFFLTGSSSTLCKFRFYTVWIRDPRKSRCHLPRLQIHADRFTYVDLRSTYVDPGTTQVAILPDNSLYTSCEALKCTLMVLPTLDIIMEGYSGAMI